MSQAHGPLITAAGVLILLPADVEPDDRAALDRVGPDGRTQRERLAAVQADLDRLRAGAVPSAADLRDAPVLEDWSLLGLAAEALPSLTGVLAGVHPHVVPGRRILTSPVAALDARHGQWARTVSRYYVLGRPAGAVSN